MGWKKVATTTVGTAAGTGVATITIAPVLAACGAVIGGPFAPITGSIGYGIGCLLGAGAGGFAGKKIGDTIDEEE